jgi:putative transposase
MVKNHRLARSVLDSGWGCFKSMLKYKAKIVIEVNSAFTSADCSKCGNHVPKSLAVRTLIAVTNVTLSLTETTMLL